MRRIVIHRPGGYERLVIEEAPDVRPGLGEVVIEVKACGVNFADCITRMGLYASAKAYVGYPITPGFEVAGTVAAVGEAVTDLAVGTPVLALTLFGGYASQLKVPRGQVFPLPEGWSFAQAAGLPTAFLTAWFALFELGHPRPGAKVLVHSAAGGVGGALVQLASLAGADVTAVVGAPHKRGLPRDLGAQAVIDKASEPLWPAAAARAPEGFDLILDANGAATLAEGYRHLAPGGKLVVYGFHSMFAKGRGRPNWLKLTYDYLRTPRFSPLRLTQENRSVLGFNLSFLSRRSDLLRLAMTELLGWAEEGKIVPLPTTEYPFSAVADAHRALESGQSVGKLVLKLPPAD